MKVRPSTRTSVDEAEKNDTPESAPETTPEPENTQMDAAANVTSPVEQTTRQGQN